MLFLLFLLFWTPTMALVHSNNRKNRKNSKGAGEMLAFKLTCESMLPGNLWATSQQRTTSSLSRLTAHAL